MSKRKNYAPAFKAKVSLATLGFVQLNRLLQGCYRLCRLHLSRKSVLKVEAEATCPRL